MHAALHARRPDKLRSRMSAVSALTVAPSILVVVDERHVERVGPRRARGNQMSTLRSHGGPAVGDESPSADPRVTTWAAKQRGS